MKNVDLEVGSQVMTTLHVVFAQDFRVIVYNVQEQLTASEGKM